MNVKAIINSWDLWFAAVLTMASAMLFPRYLEAAAVRDFYSVGTAVLSTVFSVFFAALAIIMSSSDDDFIEFLEQEGGYSKLVSTFRFTLLILFIALVFSVAAYVYTYIRLANSVKIQNKALLISFEFLFLYGLFAALASALDTMSYARYRSKFLAARRQARQNSLSPGPEVQNVINASLSENSSNEPCVARAIEKSRDSRRFETASDIRKFEIELFWKRSLFFWGFIAAAFVAIAALKSEQPTLSLLVSELGTVCSLAWTLVNRGSKYWQEQWETKIEEVEDRVTGPLFKRKEQPKNGGWWLQGRHYSVSRLAIAISDSVFLFWTAVYVRQLWICLVFGTPSNLSKAAIWALSAPATILGVAILVLGRSGPHKNGTT